MFDERMNTPETFGEIEAHKLIENFDNDIFPYSVKYLTEERGLSLETLRAFRVGVGQQKFRNETDGHLSLYEAVFFPLYQPRKEKPKPKEEVNISMKTKIIREEMAA